VAEDTRKDNKGDGNLGNEVKLVYRTLTGGCDEQIGYMEFQTELEKVSDLAWGVLLGPALLVVRKWKGDTRDRPG